MVLLVAVCKEVLAYSLCVYTCSVVLCVCVCVVCDVRSVECVVCV